MYGTNQDRCKQVRPKGGGGTRHISKDAKKEDILREALSLFFPNENSSKGKEENFTFDILDFKSNPMSKNITVDKLFKITGLTKLRFYLASYKKEKNSELSGGLETTPSPSTSHIETFYSDFSGDLQFEQSYRVDDEVIISNDDLVVQSPTFTTDLDLSDLITPVVRVHRGRVFEDFLDFFKNVQPTYNTIFRIKMISANGNEETGVDVGGIFRDALSEFWETL